MKTPHTRVLLTYLLAACLDVVTPQTPSYFCPSLPSPSNGQVEISPDGSKAQYTCNEGFSLYGHPSRVCCETEWLGRTPLCAQNGQWGEWTHWASCSQTCGSGTSTRQRSCDSPPPDRYGNDCEGSASESQPCFIEGCSECNVTDIRGPVSVHVSDDGLTASLTCPDGYVPVGGETRSCNSTSETWNAEIYMPVPCRSRCGPLDPPRNGSVLLDDASGAIYFCDEGFQLIGSSERRCLGCGGGKWTGAEPFCVKPGPEKLIGVHPVIYLDSGSHKVSSHIFYMAAASDIRPALRSIFFYYRIPRGAGNVLVMAQLLDTVTNSTVGRSSLITLKASGFEFVFTPVCIQLSSDRRQSFDSRIQLQVTVPSDTTYEMRRLETSKTDACRVKSGECPAVSDFVPTRCGLYCQHDGNCPEKMKCCSTKCGVDCINPINASQIAEPEPLDDGSVSFDCPDDGSGGDCGFKSSSCGSTAWKLSLNDTEKTLPVSASPGRECTMDVCVDCLYPNSFSDTTVMSSSRKRRSFVGDAAKAGRAAFAFIPNGDNPFQWGTLPSALIPKAYKSLQFHVRMIEGEPGSFTGHHLTVWLRCYLDDSKEINLGDRYRPGKYLHYHIPHFNNVGIDRRVTILDIDEKIENQFPGGLTMCPQYYVEFRGSAIGTALIVSSIFFSKERDCPP